MRFNETTIRLPSVLYKSISPIFGFPVREHPDPTNQYGFCDGMALYLPRWTYLLFQAKQNPYAALKLLEQRYIDDVDRRLKEKNL